MPEERDFSTIYDACTRYVYGHYPQTPKQALAALAEYTPTDAKLDFYGEGDLFTDFEARIAEMLGKPAAVFMPSGTMAQQIALRIVADRSGRWAFACHPTCHLVLHEDNAYRDLHGLKAEIVGNQFRLLTLDALQRIDVPLGSVLVELPQRHNGGLLPTWDDLVALTDWAREAGIHLHMDGARLWECQPYYERSYAEIAALFDTVYVSFYKILGNVAGAALAGPADLIAEARVWQHRHGGRLFHLYPNVLSAQMGLDTFLPQIGAYHAKAVEIAAAIKGIDGIEVTPDPPQTNMLHIFMRGDADRLKEAIYDIAEETGTMLVRTPQPGQVPGWQKSELSVGSASLDVPTDEIAALFADLIARANA
jgi:threonine aldolase